VHNCTVLLLQHKSSMHYCLLAIRIQGRITGFQFLCLLSIIQKLSRISKITALLALADFLNLLNGYTVLCMVSKIRPNVIYNIHHLLVS